ncbi:hypothetical protein CYMTET_3552 [Cymbomonas tetramitiformis]|uniref:Uncharacterized protein n=1 Tax=Cymbomonas tetramitiformis TaxID=36881 RepID=A0AAE0H339_9CHLO|nr:hypothetical protein CYMTET_3552 [Cymbomonas tetramitiformis]|eukprot:gene18175-21652_t
MAEIAQKAAKQVGDGDSMQPAASTNNLIYQETEESDCDVDTAYEDSERRTPVEAIICKTQKGSYVALRESSDFINLTVERDPQRPRDDDGDDDGQDPSRGQLPLELVREYEASAAQFRIALQDRTAKDKSEIDLEDLAAGSPLEMVHFLGTMRYEGGPLHQSNNSKSKRQKTDTPIELPITVPAIALSQLIQRIVDCYRRKEREMKRELKTLQHALRVAQGTTNGTGADVHAMDLISKKKTEVTASLISSEE